MSGYYNQGGRGGGRPFCFHRKNGSRKLRLGKDNPTDFSIKIPKFT